MNQDKILETRMVDVTDKAVTQRIAIAYGQIQMHPDTLQQIQNQAIQKGDVFTIAKMAGIQGAKKCAEIIPLCHPLLLTGISVKLEPDPVNACIHITATVKVTGQTGVEMEALSAVSATALTIYDMCKGIDKEMVIQKITLLEKAGGRSGHYQRQGEHLRHD